MNKDISITTIEKPFVTESGFQFPDLDIAWKSWGKLSEDKDNVILICHALTGHAAADEWFHGLFEEDGPFDLESQFVICINSLGSCYGSTGPWSINSQTGEAYRETFPVISIRDIVRFQQVLLDELNIQGIECIVGASMGGMIALEFSIMDKRIQKSVLIAMGKSHSAWAIGISEAQRAAIYSDPKWNDGKYDRDDAPEQGLAAARMMAMITYRSPWDYNQKFSREKQDSDQFKVESYLNYQGQKLVDRFDAHTYVSLTKAMDSHDVSRNRKGFKEVLSGLHQDILVIGITSDHLYPINEQIELSELIPNALFHELDSKFGHDAFLLEFDALKPILKPFIQEKQTLSYVSNL